ncbi:hypothetical protein G7046_g6695 [Stylonectria norvegica]|nr:hypothetical protein G7046_g6695 [Stylonectria norvegica]
MYTPERLRRPDYRKKTTYQQKNKQVPRRVDARARSRRTARVLNREEKAPIITNIDIIAQAARDTARETPIPLGLCMSVQAGRHTGLAVCLSGVTSASAVSASVIPASITTTPRISGRRRLLQQGQFTLLRSHHEPHCRSLPLRVLQTASIVALSSCCTYLTSATSAAAASPSVSVSVSPGVARHSLPQLSSLRSSLCCWPSLMAAAHQTRGHAGGTGGNGQGHEQDHDHDHDHLKPHSHSPLSHHHHHHDNAFLTSSNKNDPGVRITRIGLVCNLGMAVAKFAGGWAFNSKAMTADAWHSITDLASDVLTLATVSWSLKPPTDRFPMGFGKIESLGSLGVSGMLLAGGMYMGWESGISLYGHFYPEMAGDMIGHAAHGHSHSHGAMALGIPSMHAAWLAGGTILVKEWLYHATMKVARERKSSVLASNAIHHRVDSLTGFVTLAAIVGANVMENAAWLDPTGGLLISVMVIQAGWGNTMAALNELADKSIDAEVKASVRKQAQKALINIEGSHDIELRDISGVKSGQNYLVDLEMAVPGSWTVENAKEVEDAVRTLVGAKVRGLRRIRLRFTPKEGPVNAKFDDFIVGTVTPPTAEEEESAEEEQSHGNHKH